jgi:hypothetical protein
MKVLQRKTLTVVAFLAATLTTAPALAQVDLSGTWNQRWHEDWQEITAGPDGIDYFGLALSADGRARALSFSPSLLSQPERQCVYYSSWYLLTGSVGIRIWPESDPNSGAVVAWHISGTLDRFPITVWMDGRPHPSPYTSHTPGGFTTGVWEGPTLTTYTTHLSGGYLRRNGTPHSDQATLRMHITRYGSLLTIAGILEDPVYLTEPQVISRSWQLDPNQNIATIGPPCVPEAELADLKGEGEVPHYLPGRNPFVNEVTERYHIPADAVLGGAETMYPEYRKKLKDAFVAPAQCTRYCCGWGGGGSTAGLQCITDGTGRVQP